MQRLNNDRGAVAVVVALLAVPLLGFAAVAIDVAAVHAERQQLQNGADAAALAIAQACADGDCGDYPTTATTLAEANKNNLDVQASSTPVTESTGTVTVTTVPKDGDVDHWFAPLIGVDNTEVSESATAEWGGLGKYNASLPVIFSACVIENLINQAGTGGGSAFKFINGQYQLVAPFSEKVVIYLNGSDSGVSKNCTPKAPGPSGTSPPGGFGYISNETDADSDGCSVQTDVDDWVPSKTGANMGDLCNWADLDAIVKAGEPIVLPVHNGFKDGGSGGKYFVYGYVGFKLTGWGLNIPGSDPQGGDKPCSGKGSKDQCISGYFTTVVPPNGPLDPNAPSLGASTYRLTK